MARPYTWYASHINQCLMGMAQGNGHPPGRFSPQGTQTSWFISLIQVVVLDLYSGPRIQLSCPSHLIINYRSQWHAQQFIRERRK